MKKLKIFIQFFWGLALIAVIAWGGYKLAALAVSYMSAVRKEILIVLIFGSLVITLSAFINAAGQRGAAKVANRGKDKEWKAALYEDVTTASLAIFFAEAEGEKRQVDCAPLMEQLTRCEPQLALRGSAKVVRKYNRFKEQLVQAEYIDLRLARGFMNLLVEMRNDLGDNKKNILDISDFQDIFGFKET